MLHLKFFSVANHRSALSSTICTAIPSFCTILKVAKISTYTIFIIVCRIIYLSYIQVKKRKSKIQGYFMFGMFQVVFCERQRATIPRTEQNVSTAALTSLKNFYHYLAQIVSRKQIAKMRKEFRNRKIVTDVMVFNYIKYINK